MSEKIVLASANAGKIRELQALLNQHRIIPQSDFQVPEVEESGLSFVENAILKARNAASHSGLAAIADDSGLAVDALDGAPGIYSARYAGPGASDRDNLEKVLAELRGVPEALRSARFHCLLVYLRHPADPTPIIAQGVWEGLILERPQGTNGFGYDPIFYLPEQGCSAAELAPGQKNRLSHRGQALRRLAAMLD